MKWLILLMPLLMLALVSGAVDTNVVDDTFQLNDIINYAKPCYNNNTFCSGSSKCNFTVQDPDNIIVVDNLQGTNQVSNHNMSITFSKIGLYKVDMVCVDGTLRGSETFYAQVTGSGFNNTYGFFVVILLLSFGVMAFGFWKQDATITILGSFGLYFLGLYILFNGIADIKDPVYTWSSGLLTLAIAFYVSARSTYELVTG